MAPEFLPGICGEPTTYRAEYRPHKLAKERAKIRDDKKISELKKSAQLFAESHDTFQKLNYESRLPFNALWQPKEIVGNANKTFLRKYQPDLDPNGPKIEVISPAVSLDDVKDSEARKLVVDYTYKTTTARAADQVWRDFHETDETLLHPETNENSADPLSIKLNLIPEIPAGFKSAAKKWDSLQDRTLVDVGQERSKPSHLVEGNLLKPSENRRVLNAARLAYEKLHVSYGGHRTPVALGVPLEKKKVSIYHPDLTVSQALNSRRH